MQGEVGLVPERRLWLVTSLMDLFVLMEPSIVARISPTSSDGDDTSVDRRPIGITGLHTIGACAESEATDELPPIVWRRCKDGRMPEGLVVVGDDLHRDSPTEWRMAF